TATEDARGRAETIARGLEKDLGIRVCDGDEEGCDLRTDSKLVALIAYLQRLGRIPQKKSEAVAELETKDDEVTR
ncbi:MAG TPA: hypothetical protein VK116_01425, partial [Planctomycetota bacterium]|nr:hypothetical protein [Planctomycetota bacterium]